jgi:hypothetical protein
MKSSKKAKDLIMFMSKDQKIIFGSASLQYHIIEPSDRDYNTIWSFSKDQVEKLSEEQIFEISNLTMSFV